MKGPAPEMVDVSTLPPEILEHWAQTKRQLEMERQKGVKAYEDFVEQIRKACIMVLCDKELVADAVRKYGYDFKLVEDMREKITSKDHEGRTRLHIPIPKSGARTMIAGYNSNDMLIQQSIMTGISITEMEDMSMDQLQRDPRFTSTIDRRLIFNIDKSSTYVGEKTKQMGLAGAGSAAHVQQHSRDITYAKCGEEDSRRAIAYTSLMSAAGDLDFIRIHLTDHSYNGTAAIPRPAELHKLPDQAPNFVITNGTQFCSSDAEETHLVFELAFKTIVAKRECIMEEKRKICLGPVALGGTGKGPRCAPGAPRTAAPIASSPGGASMSVEATMSYGSGMSVTELAQMLEEEEEEEEEERIAEADDDILERVLSCLLMLDGEYFQTEMCQEAGGFGERCTQIRIDLMKLAAACSKAQQALDVAKCFAIFKNFFAGVMFKFLKRHTTIRPEYMWLVDKLIANVPPASRRLFDKFFLTLQNIVSTAHSVSNNVQGFSVAGVGMPVDVRTILLQCSTIPNNFSPEEVDEIIAHTYTIARLGFQDTVYEEEEGASIPDDTMERYLEPYFGPCMELVQNEKPTQDRANNQWRAVRMNSPSNTKRIARELKEKEEKAEEARAKKAEKAAERQAKADGRNTRCFCHAFFSCKARVRATEVDDSQHGWQRCGVGRCKQPFCPACCETRLAMHRESHA
ncbi:hypothetical protein B484DRAFT_393695 [Ochromonadaceae sp. CCMP2298]|nr:hypothetical protein B484DRAFT_393695 [Ochromonadaceae sp. CCMP2298]